MTRDTAEPSSDDWAFTTAASRDLVGAARAARSLATRHCRGCLWYHGSWTWWRALGLTTGAERDREFFRDAAGELPAGARVLVSGSADSALAAVAADVAGGVDAAIHVLDRCETPLRICDRFARRNGITIRTHAADILDFHHERGFHLILVHSFLGFVRPERRGRLFARWGSLLAPGGRLRMVQRIRPAAGSAVLQFDAGQARRFAETVARHARARAGREECAALARAARAYTRRKRTHPVSGVEEIEALAHGGALRMIDCAVRDVPPVPGAVTGPTRRNGARYAYLVATRDC